MALILSSHLSPLPILEGYDDSLLGVLPEYRSAKSLSDQIIDRQVVKVERDGNKILLTFNYSHLLNKTFTIDSSIFKSKERLNVYMQKTGNFVVIPLNDIQFRDHGFHKLITLKNLVTGIGPVAEIYFHNSASEGVVVVNGLPVSNETFDIKNKFSNFTDYVITHFPTVAELQAIDAAKSKVLYNLNNINSIVALEQQVDLLTTLVSNLINSQEQPAWAANFLSKVATSNVTTVRSVTDIITDLDSNKKKIRSEQQKYFDSK
jgi:hypothetical protein